MKKAVVELIQTKLKKDWKEIDYELYKNTRLINELAEKQRVLKKARHELTKLINEIK